MRLLAFAAVVLLAPAARAKNLHWDANRTTAGASTTPTGTWSTSGSTNRKRSISSAGTASTVNWTSGRDAVFSAGTDAVNALTVTVSGTLRLSGASYTFGTLNVTANAIIDFAGSTTLNPTNLSISAGVTLTVQNWQNTVDFSTRRISPAPPSTAAAPAPPARSCSTASPGSSTLWQSYDHQAPPSPSRPPMGRC